MALNVFQQFLHRPQQVWLRKAMFQIHLWVGIFVAIYVVLIGLSGSILVFKEELRSLSREASLQPASSEINIDSMQAVEAVQTAYPKKKMSFLYTPREKHPTYVVYTMEDKKSAIFHVDPSNGKILGTVQAEKSILNWVGQLHYYLLLGRSPGLTLNGIGAALLLLLCISGMVLWWPGLKTWARGFVVDFSKSWKRINFDTHNVIGFWTLSIVSFWAISGVYFAWPREFATAVNFISPVSQRNQRITVPPNQSGNWADVRAMIQDAVETRTPGKKMAAIRFPLMNTAPFMFYLADQGSEDLIGADFVYYEPATGKFLQTVNRAEKKTAGDWIMWSMIPLHFGTSFGMGVKILYFILGFSLPLLVVTGTIMYWNRYLGKKWRKMKEPKQTVIHLPAAVSGSSSTTAVHAKETVSKT